MIISIVGTFDQAGVVRWVTDMAGAAVSDTLQFTETGLSFQLPDDISQDVENTLRRVIHANKYPFRKTYTGTFNPGKLSSEMSAFGVSIESCTEEEVSIVYDMPDDGLPADFEQGLDAVIANHNPNYLSPEEIRRNALKAAWVVYAGQPIDSLPIEDLTQLVILYLSLNTNTIAPDGTIRPIA